MRTVIQKRIKAFGKDCCGKDFYYDFPIPNLPKDISSKTYAYGYVEGQLQRHVHLKDFQIKEYEACYKFSD